MIKVTRFKPYKKGALQGFADITISSWADLFIRGISVYQTADKRWINFPSNKLEEKSPEGKDQYAPLIGFKDFKTKNTFDDKFFTALDQFNKENSTPPNPQSKPQNYDDLPF